MSRPTDKRIWEGAYAVLMALAPDNEEEFIGLLDKIAEGIRLDPQGTKETLKDFVQMATASESGS